MLKFFESFSYFSSATKHIFVPLGLETFCPFEHLEKMGNMVGTNENEKAGRSRGSAHTRDSVRALVFI